MLSHLLCTQGLRVLQLRTQRAGAYPVEMAGRLQVKAH